MSGLSLETDIESIVLAMWDEPEEEITREVMARFDLSYEHAAETVRAAIAAEVEIFGEWDEDPEADEWDY